MEVLDLKGVMELLGIGKKAATALLNQPGCPTFPRRKGGKFLISKDALIRYLGREK